MLRLPDETGLSEPAYALTVQDRAFRYGDGLFETIRIHHKVAYLWHLHKARLARGAEILGIPLDFSALEASVCTLLGEEENPEGVLRIGVSRGIGGRGYLPPPIEETRPRIILEFFPLPEPPARPLVAFLSEYRRIPPACLPNDCKTAQGLNSILALQQATQHGGDEALQLSVEGHLASFSSGNLFWRSGGRIFTPSLETGCLAGTTRARLLQLFPEITEIAAPRERLREAEGILRTNSASLCVAISEIAGHSRHEGSAAWAREWQAVLMKDMEKQCGSRDHA